ncbi:hypothetical protein [Lentzea flava]|uniref:Intersectin-EH binding protein Ibp1 n=1 Tax=Lentzea flava TaxID=103732 RepID=A0ABQ2VAP6_9PSEU|nr:hypothetical protein [Lentzea flava]MCP2204364.1 hypothetical protein [Lentzea flava]GGU76680.1 hypothetical protein GCM10010178_79830 [Lentzea flava]
MSSFLRRGIVAVAGLAIMLGTGGSAFAGTVVTPADGGNPATPIQCQPAKPLDPGVPFVPALPIQEQPSTPAPVGAPSVPANRLECQPAQPLEPGTPTVPAKPIGQAK